METKKRKQQENCKKTVLLLHLSSSGGGSGRLEGLLMASQFATDVEVRRLGMRGNDALSPSPTSPDVMTLYPCCSRLCRSLAETPNRCVMLGGSNNF
ncbi:hypothetical protein MTO96_002506 [Rhipicephalus appendiculatus]